MIPFEYRRVDREFIGRLVNVVSEDGESVVILGARYCGKRYLLGQLRNELKRVGTEVVVPIRLLADSPVTSEEQVRVLIEEAIRSAGEEVPPGPLSENEMFGPLDRFWAATRRSVVLMAANVDGMAYHLARRFLQGVQTRVQEQRLRAVMSGESDFSDLVHGPNSEFSCAHQYVLQYYAEDLFGEITERYAQVLNITFRQPDEAHHLLWELTGGNAFLMRLALWAVVEARARREAVPGEPVATEEFPASLKLVGIPGAYGAHVFRYATRMVAQEPACWEMLEKFVEGDGTATVEKNPPTHLELAGLLVRETHFLQSALKFSSILMADFARRYYDARRFGDLYARNGQWKAAFKHYAQLRSDERMRPSGINDRAEVEATVNALCASMFTEAAKGVEAVKMLFMGGVTSVLGFPDVVFLERNASGWHYKEEMPDQFAPIRAELEEVSLLLPTMQTETASLYQLSQEWGRHMVAAILPTLRTERQEAIIVGDIRVKNVLSRERLRLTERLLSHFVKAYSHAITVKRTEARLETRNRHVSIINSIFESLGSNVRDAGHAIAIAARELRKLGYSRVLISLVDPKHEMIRGVCDDSDNPTIDVAAETNWPLDKPGADLQPYIIHTKEPKIISDASKEPLANKDIVSAAGMRAEALVPILNRSDDAIGTIHIERADCDVPSQEEVEDLLEFGRQLAIAIEQSERVNLLQSALDKIPEPVIIFDRLARVRYGNKLAGEFLKVTTRWRRPQETQRLEGERTQRLLDDVHHALESELRMVSHVVGIGGLARYRGAVLVDRIQDFRKETVGALLHIQDLNYFYQIFEAFLLVAEANDIEAAMRSLLNATELLGHKWGRFYIVAEGDPERLVSKFSYGFDDPLFDANFNSGKIDMPRRGDRGFRTWECIEKGEPIIFCWNQGSEDGQRLYSKHGLLVTNSNPPYCARELRKRPGDYWIDLPLILGDTVHGKLTLHCDEENFRPEHFELLKVFFDGMVKAFVSRERQIKQRERWIRQAAEETMAVTAHNIGSRLASLPWLINECEMLQTGSLALGEWIKNAKRTVDTVLQTITRVKERLAMVKVHPQDLDLVSHVKWVMDSALPGKGEWELVDTADSLDASLDRYLLELVLIELVQNSREAVRSGTKLYIAISIEPLQKNSIDYLRILYRDNGPGVPETDKKRIFDYFFSRRPGRKKGTGMGLGFVRRVVDAHGGLIQEIGQEGRGVEFEIVIERYTSQADLKEDDNVSYSTR
jgi:nitrogen-specific signal transduction histidine kinase